MYPVGNTHAVVPDCRRGRQSLINCRATVTRVNNLFEVPKDFANPLISVSRKGVVEDASLLTSQVLIGPSGITRITAHALLFLVWAHEADGSVWPGRSNAHVARWAKKQKLGKVDGPLGGMALTIISRCEGKNYVSPREAMLTADKSVRAFLLAVFLTPPARIVATVSGSSVYHFVSPELWLLTSASKAPPHYLKSQLVTMPTETCSRGNPMAVWCKERRWCLTNNGSATSEVLPKQAVSQLFGNDYDASPFFCAPITGSMFCVYLRRAVIAYSAVATGAFVVTLYPAACASPPSNAQWARTVLEATPLPPLHKAKLYNAEMVTWSHIFYWHVELKMKAISLVGHTPAAIEMCLANDSGGGTWLDLASMNCVHVDTTLLATAPGDKIVAASINEGRMLKQNKGSLDLMHLAAIRTPACVRVSLDRLATGQRVLDRTRKRSRSPSL